MLIETRNLRVFLYQEIIDMRAGFERLLYFVREKMGGKIDHGHLYIFFGKNRRRMKALYFDGSGLVQLSKRIEKGRFACRAELVDISEISTTELKQIFHGGVIVRPKVERSVVTKEKNTFLPKGFGQDIAHASP